MILFSVLLSSFVALTHAVLWSGGAGVSSNLPQGALNNRAFRENVAEYSYHYLVWINICHNPTQLNAKLGKPYFPKQNHKTTPKPSVTFSQLLHNQTRPNSVCNLISTQIEDSCKKIGSQLEDSGTEQ